MTPLSSWTPRPRPDARSLEGRHVRLEKLDAARHGADLGAALTGPAIAALYDYLPNPPPTTPADLMPWLETAAASPDPWFYAIIDLATGRAVGRLSLLRIDPANGVIEVGHILYSPALQRTRAATEVQFLLMRHVFDDLGYRRYEWKCNDRNVPSKRAGVRYGFSYEGLFRQHMIVKGENRDTAWFAMIDGEWPALKAAYERWLAPDNFDADGRQRVALGTLTAAALGRAEEDGA